jgi:hypothetical protein
MGVPSKPRFLRLGWDTTNLNQATVILSDELSEKSKDLLFGNLAESQ